MRTNVGVNVTVTRRRQRTSSWLGLITGMCLLAVVVGWHVGRAIVTCVFWLIDVVRKLVNEYQGHSQAKEYDD